LLRNLAMAAVVAAVFLLEAGRILRFR